jgi:tRNA/rRNA methyltransferase
LLFGPEDHGLSNKDLEHCQQLITIPANPEYQSFNVAQAAAICLYEIYVASLEEPALENEIQRAQAEDIERLFEIMRSSLLKIGFLDSENPEHILLALRRILGRSGLEERDARILTAMFRQIEWYAKQGWKVVEEKERQGIKIK